MLHRSHQRLVLVSLAAVLLSLLSSISVFAKMFRGLFYMVLCFLVCNAFHGLRPFDDDLNVLWEKYKTNFAKNYSSVEDKGRRLIWEQNVHMIAHHNLEADQGLHTYWLQVNKFADMTPKELDSYRKCFKMKKTVINDAKIFNSNLYSNFLPPEIDWRQKGYVTPIKDQGACGSCWAFSATGSLEGQHKRATGQLVSLSEQNLVDCSWDEGNEGCEGGWQDYAFKYVIYNKGIDTEMSYPYKGVDDSCRFKSSTIGATCRSIGYIRAGNETDLQYATANIGPISIAIDASSNKFMYYDHGIFYDKTCSKFELDHAVLVVGYGKQKNRDYWIVKNSWGTTWGMEGYILMARNANNLCGIATHARYPVV